MPGILLVLAFVSGMAVSPVAEAACPGSGFTATGFVNLQSCTETKINTDIQTITLDVPASTASGDLLIAVVMTDGNENIDVPVGWASITEVTAGDNDGTLAVLKRTAGSSEPANYAFTWSSNERAIGYMMRFTGTDSTTLFTSDSGQNNTGAAVAPTLNTAVANTLVLRIFGQDDDDFGPPNDDAVVAGYETITKDESANGGGAGVSSSAAFLNQVTAGLTGTATFADGGNEQWAAVTLGIQPGSPAPPTVPPFSCPDTDGTFSGSQLVVLEECTSFQGGTDAASLNIPAPGTASVGNYMVAVINTDGNELPFSAVPAGWTVLTQTEGSGVTFAVYGKFFTATEPATYNWTLNSNEQRYGYIMLFSGASGLTIPGSPIINTATSAAPNTPALTTLVDDTLVLKLAASDDDDVAINPIGLVPGFNNITSNSSSLSGAAVSGQAVFVNQETAGIVGSESFPLTASEFWRATTIGVEPYEFRFSMADTVSSVCGIQQVTLQVTDSAGNPLTDFIGTVNLSITTTVLADAVGAEWLDLDSSLSGTLGASTNGAATYEFATGDNGVAVFDFHSPNATNVNFNLVHDQNGPTFTENASFDPTLVVDDNCRFNISHDGTAGTCSIEPITITLVDSEGNQATRYDGETASITLSSGTGGNFSLNTGAGTLAPDPDNDNNGAVSYTFDSTDNGQVILNYSNTSAQTVNFNVADATNGFVTNTVSPGTNDPDLVISGCEIRISIADPSDESDVCSVALITFTVTDTAGAVITNYSGTLNISTSSTTGDWSGGDTNTVSNGTAGNGSATYLMDPADLGNVTLSFTNPVVNAALNFNVTSTAPNGAALSDSLAGGQDPDLDVQACLIDIQVTDGAADVCSAGEVVTYTIRNRDGVAATDFEGLILLNTLEGRGDYTPSGENGTFDNGTSGNGFATYTFDTLDNGVLTVTFQDDIAGTVNLTASGSALTVDPGSDVDIVFSDCEFRITYPDATPGASDVCSIETVRITLVDSSGSTVTGYTGTVNLSTSTGNGTWADPGGLNGTLTDPFAEDGSAAYAFDAADNGVIDLAFTNATNETVNIDVTDGTTADPGSSADPNDGDITVSLCTFQISFDGGGLGSSHDDATFIGCSVQQVTIEIYDSLGNIDTDYTGTISIATSTSNGNWLDGTSLGTLTDVSGDDDGAATYQFVGGDNGLVTLEYVNVNGDTLNIDVVDGVISETGTEDPNLTVQSCGITIGAQSCVQATSTSISVDAQKPLAEQRGRMVLMVAMHEGEGEVTSPTFGGQAMTRIRRELNTNGIGNNLELWGILDEDFPAGTGPHLGSFSGLNNGPAMCLFYLTDVEQAFPQPNVTTPSDGQVNGTQGTNPGGNTGREVSVTAVTPSANNSLVMSFVANGSGGGYDDVEPDPPFTRLFQGPDANSTGFAGSSGEVILASETIVQETYDGGGDPLRDNHIVAAFAPLVTGTPVADGFVPVTLFQTFSGNISYRAIGNSLRTTRNSTDTCTFGSGDGPISATLNLPDEAGGTFDSTVEAAYLYWFGSGVFDSQPPGADFDDVTFISPSASTNVTADGVYLIEGVGGLGDLDYYAAYKNVTGLVSENGTYQVDDLDVDSSFFPFENGTACAGGFALIVVYENPFEQLRVINLFQGFQPFQNSAFALVPRNFRMATPDLTEKLPNGQITHVTVEGDENLSNGVESLEIQDTPGGIDYTPLVTFYNPLQAEFNSTITRPLYTLTNVDPGGTDQQYYLFDDTLGEDGYEIDFPGPDAGLASPDEDDEIGNTPGVDIDTHYLTGDGSGSSSDVLNAFAIAEAEEITTRYSAGQDLVLLVSEVISVTNAPIADIEVTKTAVGTFTVGGSASYQFTVKNNGNGATSFGSATGEITLSDTLPVGMTFSNTSAVSGTGWVCSVTLNPGAFTCTYDIAGTFPGGALGETSPGSGVGQSLPLLTANVQIADAATFPLLDNSTINSVRVIHTGGSCTAVANGVSPDPDTCTKSPQFDNVFDLGGGTIDINDLVNKQLNNNNVDSIEVNVRGVETDLSVQKTVIGVLEEAETGQYRIRVTNLGPDPTSVGFTISDPEPVGVDFTTIVADADWNCGDDAVSITPPLDCTYVGTGLLVGQFKDLIFNVDVTGSSGQNVSNTVQVDTGPTNFDTNSGNDISTVITPITAPPAAATEKFLLSVSSISTSSVTIGGLTFENDDLIIYDPLTDTAVSFFDNSALGYSVDDPNAVHLLPNGHVVLSADGNSTIGSNNLAFQPNDLVRYDPLTSVATTLFNGDDYTATTGVNIDAAYVLDNGDIVFSTESAVVGGLTGGGNWSDSDLIRFTEDLDGNGTADDPGFVLYLDAEDTDVFGAGTVNVDALYINVDGSDATAVIDTFDLSSDNEGTVVSDDNTVFGQDDVVQLVVDDNANPDVTTGENLFFGNLPTGIFTSADSDRRLNALHTLQTGYLGLFAISQSQAGNTCQAGEFTITKLQGLSSDIDTDYFGTINITTSTGTGDWSITGGSANLSNGTSNDGAATYTFDGSEGGSITLNLSVEVATPVLNINVTNGVVSEGGVDPDFSFNSFITTVSYLDTFSTSAFTNNEEAAWATPWFETDDFDGTASVYDGSGTLTAGNSGAGVSVGNVQIGAGRLSLTSNTNTDSTGRDPSLARRVDLSSYAVTEDVFLDFDYTYSSLNTSDSVIVEVSSDGLELYDQTKNWVAFPAYTGLTGTNASATSQSLNVTTLGGGIVFTGFLDVRFRVANGYLLASQFNVEEVELRTGSTDCDAGSAFDHYAISVGPTLAGLITGPASTTVDGISCKRSLVRVNAHNGGDLNAPSNETITISAFDENNVARGSWALATGAGTFTEGSVTDGTATYAFGTDESQVLFFYNYTNVVLSNDNFEDINFRVNGATIAGDNDELASEDPTLRMAPVIIEFLNNTGGASTNIPNQISGKSSNVAPNASDLFVQVLRVSDDDPNQCAPFVAPGQSFDFSFALECIDDDVCRSGSLTDPVTVNGTPVVNVDSNAGGNASAYTSGVSLTFADAGSGVTAAPIVLNYQDAGNVQLHASFDIPLSLDPGNITGRPAGANTPLFASSNVFTVRPFAFDIDFTNDRATTPMDISDADSYALDSDGTTFQVAGTPFSTTVTAVQWQAADDSNNDGVPDTSAFLADNLPTPNFGKDSNANSYKVGISSVTTAPAGGYGELTNTNFATFDSGFEEQDMTFDEVGIINLTAQLQTTGTTTSVNYLGSGESISGLVNNVGRFYPASLELNPAKDIISRARARSESMCLAPNNDFTYMGEDFGIRGTLEAQNSNGDRTVNYVDGFAKFFATQASDLAVSNFTASVTLAGPDTVLSSRLSSGSPQGPSLTWAASGAFTSPAAAGDRGLGELSGNLQFNRQASGAEDGPYPAVSIGLSSSDSDGVAIELTTDLDDVGGNDVVILASEAFRYGRLILQNSFGPETEPLDIPLQVQYWDGSSFVVNTDDNCTVLFYDATTAAAANRSLFFRTDTNADPDLSSYQDNLSNGDTVIESDAVVGATDVTVSIKDGETGLTSTADVDMDDQPDDRPFEASAPGLGNEGSVVIEFNLTDPDLPYPLDFLSYDWRTTGELEDDNQDGVYTDNPRSRLEFGSYRGHDRVINWQEIYIGPN